MTSAFKTILGEISPDKPYNLHSHTQWCDGRAPIADMVATAVSEGFTHYGITPHSPIIVPSTCNMSRTSVLEYVAEFRRLKQEYEGRIKLFLSMEIDYLGPEWGPAHGYFQSLPLDYRIGSVHFVPNREGEQCDIDGPPEHFARNVAGKFGGDLRYVVETYFDHKLAMIRAGGFDMIGHFDKVSYNASCLQPGIDREAWFVDRVMEVIDAIGEAGIAAEINTKGRDSIGRFFPDERYWPELLRRGIPLVVNSDAHFPSKLNSGRDEALRLLASMQ